MMAGRRARLYLLCAFHSIVVAVADVVDGRESRRREGRDSDRELLTYAPCSLYVVLTTAEKPP